MWQTVKIPTSKGAVRGVLYLVEGDARGAVVMVGGAGGGIHGPANSYEELAARLRKDGVTPFRLEYRRSNDLKECVYDSVESASQVYKSLKKDFPTSPQPSPRRLALFEFVMKQPEVTVLSEGGIPKVPSWAMLFRSWNGSLPAGHEWHYDDRRNFRRDFLKAFDQIVNYYR